MKRHYAKPTLVKRQQLSVVTAICNVVSQINCPS
jgi:hypothetical protein